MKIQGCSKKSGFTLFELLISLVVISILSGVSCYIYKAVQNKAEHLQLLMDAYRWRQALLDYYSHYGTWPSYWKGTNQWRDISRDFAWFVDDFSGERVTCDNPEKEVFCHFTPKEHSEHTVPTVFFWMGDVSQQSADILPFLERKVKQPVCIEKVVGWGSPVLFFIPK